MNLLKTSVLSAFATGIKILSAFVINKLIALEIGPEGLAIVGQYQSLVLMVITLSTGAIEAGVIKYIAEHREDPERQQSVIRHAVKISLLSSFCLAGFLLLFGNLLSLRLFERADYAGLLYLLGITASLCGLNTILLSILNGFQDIRRFIGLNILTSLIGLFIIPPLALSLGVQGVLLALTITQPIAFFFTAWVSVRSGRIRWSDFFASLKSGFQVPVLFGLLQFSLMAISATIPVLVVQMFIRNYLIDTLSLADAGYWQAITKISDLYLLMVTTTFSTYFLPRLSELKDPAALRRELIGGYRVILPIVFMTSSLVYLFRRPLIELLFAKSFAPMDNLFLFQFLGDFLKMGSWLLGYLLMAKAMTRWFVLIQIVFSATYAVLTIGFVDAFGTVGATYAFALNNLLCLGVAVWIFRDLLFPVPSQVVVVDEIQSGKERAPHVAIPG